MDFNVSPSPLVSLGLGTQGLGRDNNIQNSVELSCQIGTEDDTKISWLPFTYPMPKTILDFLCFFLELFVSLLVSDSVPSSVLIISMTPPDSCLSTELFVG